MSRRLTLLLLALGACVVGAACAHGTHRVFEAVAKQDRGVRYRGTPGPGVGTHVVLVAGDEEYRSEETLPALRKVQRQGKVRLVGVS